jgi:hypothetical protein
MERRERKQKQKARTLPSAFIHLLFAHYSLLRESQFVKRFTVAEKERCHLRVELAYQLAPRDQYAYLCYDATRQSQAVPQGSETEKETHSKRTEPIADSE